VSANKRLLIEPSESCLKNFANKNMDNIEEKNYWRDFVVPSL